MVKNGDSTLGRVVRFLVEFTNGFVEGKDAANPFFCGKIWKKRKGRLRWWQAATSKSFYLSLSLMLSYIVDKYKYKPQLFVRFTDKNFTSA